MKLFLKKIGINLFIVLLITGGVLYAFQDHYWLNRVPVIKSQLFKNEDYTTVVLGTSHTYHGLNTNVFPEKTFNFAYSSQSLMEDFYILKTIKKESESLNKVILPISYFTNSHYLYTIPEDGEAIRIFEYEHAYGISYPKTWTYFKSHLKLFSVLSRNILKTGPNNTVDQAGNLYSPCNEGKTSDVETEFKRHEFSASFVNIHPYFDSIYNYCRDNKIKIVCVVMPFSRDYNDKLNESEFNPYLSMLTSKYHLNIIDERGFFESKDESIMFRDADHLSACGREVFSKYFAKELDTLFASTDYIH